MRKELGRVHGTLIQESGIKRGIRGAARLYAVGDMVVDTLLRIGIMPEVSIFDYMIGRERAEGDRIKAAFPRPMHARNPRGMLSKDLWSKVEKAGGSRKPVGIQVSGEEDMASVACVYHAPLGSAVLYGLPGKGINLVRVTRAVKEQVVDILERMEKSA